MGDLRMFAWEKRSVIRTTGPTLGKEVASEPWLHVAAAGGF
jgi:hypothetical protein